MLLRPDPELHFAARTWVTMCDALHARTEGHHESGAFLLGKVAGRRRLVEEIVYYDELDPEAYASGVVILHGASFGMLWTRCRQADLEVVADVHLHGGDAFQSKEDREHPMIAQPRHLALILPSFAAPSMVAETIGMFEYWGSHRWRDLGHRSIRRHLKIGI